AGRCRPAGTPRPGGPTPARTASGTSRRPRCSRRCSPGWTGSAIRPRTSRPAAAATTGERAPAPGPPRGARSGLTARAPAQVPRRQLAVQHRGAAYPARITRAPVDIGARFALGIRRRAVVVFRVDHHDAAVGDPNAHKGDQIDPDPVPFL